jgi:hypothetical protein
MKNILATSFVSLLALGAISVSAQQVNPNASLSKASISDEIFANKLSRPKTVLDGTLVKLRLSEAISSADAYPGQQISFEVSEDVIVQGVDVIPRGSYALGTVTGVTGKRRMGRGGKLNIELESVPLVDGQKVQLRAAKDIKGGGNIGIMTGAMVGSAVLVSPVIAPLFLFIHGKDATIPKGTAFSSFVYGDVVLDMAKVQEGRSPTDIVASIR